MPGRNMLSNRNKNYMKKFSIHIEASIIDALRAIEDNKHRFLICVDDSFHVTGVIVDGDIRRAFIEGKNAEDLISNVYNKNFTKIDDKSRFSEICEIFRSRKIDFIPITDKKGKLKNIITKKQFHIMLLEDVNYNPNDDFTVYDEHVLEHEVYNKPWGFYKSILLSPFAQAKILTVFPMSQLSLQEHKYREEHWVVIKGNGMCQLGETHLELYPGKYVFIPKGCKHQLLNNDRKKNLILSEVQLGDYFGEDDIIRHQDKYGRV
ncbi:CBS domain-containing protein [Thalassospira australica]|uniref:CBS domain-containing protein n=1 Tax=Thalassospira australica TaxID=1528106 RepID=UPI00384F2978